MATQSEVSAKCSVCGEHEAAWCCLYCADVICVKCAPAGVCRKCKTECRPIAPEGGIMEEIPMDEPYLEAKFWGFVIAFCPSPLIGLFIGLHLSHSKDEAYRVAGRTAVKVSATLLGIALLLLILSSLRPA